MKNFISLVVLGLASINAFAQDASVKMYYNLLSAENKAKADAGKIAKVILVEKAPVASMRRSSSKIGTNRQALVDSRTCFASVYVEKLNYGQNTDCNGNVTGSYLRNANVAVEMDFQTFAYDSTAVDVQVYAESKSSYDSLMLVDDRFTFTSDAYGSGANTVVYIVDAAYAYNYYVDADVTLSDERGTACSVTTNSVVIQ